jgi:hypothetical protein
MGLDMYLRASQYVARNDHSHENGEFISTLNPMFDEIVKQFNAEDAIDKHSFGGITVDLPMGYWRKANQIHNWFVENVQEGDDDCNKYYVTREQLEQLRSTCLEVIVDIDKAEDLLPTGAGFFFGSTEYDQYYVQDLVDTVAIINRCLSTKFDSFEYQSSW